MNHILLNVKVSLATFAGLTENGANVGHALIEPTSNLDECVMRNSGNMHADQRMV